MKKTLVIPLALLFVACGVPEPEIIVVTATPRTVIATPMPTSTPMPTNTPEPTASPAPTWEPFTIVDVEIALREDGYRRYPIKDDDGLDGFSWVKNNPYERVRTWENGRIDLEVLHDKSPIVRSEHMELKFAVLDSVLPAAFMVELREQQAVYDRSVGPDVSGEPDVAYAYGGEWQTVWAEYNASETDIGGYTIRFSLWWWQSTCPPSALFCYYNDFPGLEFTGDSSFVFYTILIYPPVSGGVSKPST